MKNKKKTIVILGILSILISLIFINRYSINETEIEDSNALALNSSTPNGTIDDYRPDIKVTLSGTDEPARYYLTTEPKFDKTVQWNPSNKTIISKPLLRLNSNVQYTNSLRRMFLDQYLIRNGQIYYRNNLNGWPSIWPTGDPNLLRTIGSGDFSCMNISIESNGTISRHLIRGGQVWFSQFTNSWSGWSNVTANVNGVGTGAIKCFNTYTGSDGYTRQHLVRGVDIWYRENLYGWSQWQKVTENITNDPNAGTGEITSFSMYSDTNGFLVQHLVRGGKIFSRTNQNGWQVWADVTNNIPANLGTGVIQGFKTGYSYQPTVEHSWNFRTKFWSSDVIQLNEEDIYKRNQFPLFSKFPYTSDGYTASYSDKRKILLKSNTLTNIQLQNDKLPSFKNFMRNNGVDNTLYPHMFEYQGRN